MSAAPGHPLVEPSVLPVGPDGRSASTLQVIVERFPAPAPREGAPTPGSEALRLAPTPAPAGSPHTLTRAAGVRGRAVGAEIPFALGGIRPDPASDRLDILGPPSDRPPDRSTSTALRPTRFRIVRQGSRRPTRIANADKDRERRRGSRSPPRAPSRPLDQAAPRRSWRKGAPGPAPAGSAWSPGSSALPITAAPKEGDVEQSVERGGRLK